MHPSPLQNQNPKIFNPQPLNLNKKPKILIGLSGGVDSAVSALRLKQAGYPVEALFMKNWEEDDGLDSQSCSVQADLESAQAVCEALEIPLHTANFATEYWDHVFEYFLSEYQAGRTPNPDILCNKEIKFKLFLDYAKQLGISKIATGHYAQISADLETPQLLRGVDLKKDQTYFLYAIKPAVLSQVFFPIGDLQKSEVRNWAQKFNLPNAARKESMGICFIGPKKFQDFLKRYLPAQPGEIRDFDQPHKILGTHQGLMYYTLGQRQGLGIGGRADSKQFKPWYVIKKDLNTNQLWVVQGSDHPQLSQTQLIAKECNWLNIPDIQIQETRQNLTAKIRHQQPVQACQLTRLDLEHYQVTFEKPQWAIAPGQSVVLYDQNMCLGGGVITELKQ